MAVIRNNSCKPTPRVKDWRILLKFYYLHATALAESNQCIRNRKKMLKFMTARTHTHSFNSPFSGTTRVRRYQKGKTNQDFTEARDSEWQWHQLGHIQVCNSLQTDNHASTPPLCFLQAGCPSCRPTNSVKALKAKVHNSSTFKNESATYW